MEVGRELELASEPLPSADSTSSSFTRFGIVRDTSPNPAERLRAPTFPARS